MTSKNILLIGPTGSGKSALGNVLINRNKNFEKVFEEGEWTKETKIEEVEIEGTKYRVIDTVGWDWGSSTSQQQILTELAQTIQAAEGKIDRILLLKKSRGDLNHIVIAFNSLKELDCELLKYITIVRSNFFEFKEQEEYERDTSNLKDSKKVNPKIAEIFNLLPIIYVNNPWINTSISQRKDETEEEFQGRRKGREEAQEENKEERKTSRQIVFNHLKKIRQESYHVDWEKINNFLNAKSESSEKKTEKTTATETKNILLIGSTKTGKSALANTLVNEDGNFAKIFEFNDNSGSTTKTTQNKEVEIEGDNYRIIDTVSLDHTSMEKQQVASELNKSFQFTEGKINQILLMVSGFFDEISCLTYHLIKEIAPELLDYTTIVITNFSDFTDSEKCNDDIESLRNLDHVNSEILEVTKNLPIIHINNSPDFPLNLIKRRENETEEKFQERKKGQEIKNETNEEKRKLSRQKIIKHLETCQKNYRLGNMNDLEAKINNFLVLGKTIGGFGKDREKMDQQPPITDLEELRKKVKKVEEERRQQSEELKERQEKLENLKQKLSELGKGNNDKRGLGGILILVIIIVAIGFIVYRWSTRKEKKS